MMKAKIIAAILFFGLTTHANEVLIYHSHQEINNHVHNNPIEQAIDSWVSDLSRNLHKQ